jgi:ADP-sugar diphosphatase
MQNIFDSIKFTSWKNSLVEQGIDIRSIDVLNSIHKPSGELLFGLVNIDAYSPDGNKLLPTVLLRGDYVCVLTCLIEKETHKRYYLLVKQRRVADGSIFYEHPAGMCDSNTDPWDVAIKEVKEETGLSITKKDLRLLYDKPLYSSPGLLDEKGYFFCCEISMASDEIESFKNRLTGAADEHEFIETYICEENELEALIKNSSGVLLNLLYQRSILPTLSEGEA